MSGAVLLSVKIYLLAAAISLAVAAVIKLIGVVMAARAAPRVVAAPAPPAAREETIGEADVAAISAAVCAVMGSHRIVHIAERSGHAAWATEGRAAHHVSHNVPRRGVSAAPPKSRR